jgi:hypothetical protein
MQSLQFFIFVDGTIARSIDRCIDMCAQMSGYCEHSSTAKSCAIFAYPCIFVTGMRQMP